MSREDVERRLAAILSADVVGYSRLMADDEAGTHAALKAHRAEFVDATIAEHHGRIVKLIGDGALVEFASVVNSVACAIDIQRGMAERNRDVPKDRRIRFRIGINLGDVIIEGDDIYGDGVNIASRIEALAEPGGICLSDDAYRQARGRLDVAFEDMGEHAVKNIPDPIRVFRVELAHAAGEIDSEDDVVAAPALSAKPSIAVLPFDNMSGDPEQEYFADGISEDLITALSRIHWFFVIARNSTFTYKGRAVNVTEVARDLGVRYVLEGSLRKAGNRVRITAQLIDATTGNHVWAEHYDRELADIFALQDEMTQTIVGAVEPELSAAERERAAHKPPDNLDAWESYQRGLWHMWRFTKDDNAEAQSLLRRAQELDPGFAIAYAYESYAHFLDVILGYAEAPGACLASALAAANEALALDDKEPVAHFAQGRVYMVQGKHAASIAALETSLEFNPSFAQACHGLGFAFALAGRLEDSADMLDRGIRLSPHDPLLFATETIRSFSCTLQHQHEAAAEWALRAVRRPQAVGGGYWPYAALAAALGNLGKTEEAEAALASAFKQKPDLSLAYVIKTLPTTQLDGLGPYLDGLRAAGLTA